MEKGISCSRSTTTPQTLNSETYDWENWSDGLSISASFTAQSNKSITANFNSRLLDIAITNDFGGGIVGVDGFDRNAPYPDQWISGTTHSFSAIDQNYQAQGEANYFREYYNWTKPGENNSTIERTFSEVVDEEGTYKANFHKWFEYEAVNNFLNGGSGGDIKIDDVTKSAPYSDHVVEDNSISMEAPDQQLTVNGRAVNYFFRHWHDGNTQNPRTTTPDDHFNIQANYKGHLVSSQSQPTGYNNGRRVYKKYDGDIYLVYEDNGDIYLTYSTDDGKNWSNEIRVDSDANNSLYPSITGSMDMIFVTWVDNIDKQVKIRRLNTNTNFWYDIRTVASFYYWNSIKPHPAISVSEIIGGQYNIYVIFQREKMADDFSPSGDPEVVCYKNSDNSYSVWEVIFGPIYGKNPSISHSKAGSNGDIGIVWDNNEKIYFKKTNYYGDWSPTKQISETVPWRIGECKPNISYTFGIAHIAWQGEDGVEELSNGFYRYFDELYNEMSYISQFAPTKGGEDVLNLSISTKQASTSSDAYDYAILYESGDAVIKLNKTGNSTSAEICGEGYAPNITEHGMARTVWTEYYSSPYFIKNDYKESGSQPISPVIRPISPRLDYIIAAAQNNNVEGCITLEVENVTFNADTLYLKDDLMTDSLSITQNYIPMEVEFKVRFHDVYNTPDPEKVFFNFVLNENQQEHLLTQVKHKELPSPNGINFEHTFKRTTLVNLMGKTGRIQFKSDSSEFILTNVYKLETESYGLAKNSAKNQIIPEKFILSQNFPNPFNPSTHITVELPKSGQVNLSVYNLNGQKVKELIAGNHEAGIYEVVFDGAGLASGIYFYRLQAGNFIHTKRMLLLK